jgi:hypothetical protein
VGPTSLKAGASPTYNNVTTLSFTVKWLPAEKYALRSCLYVYLWVYLVVISHQFGVVALAAAIAVIPMLAVVAFDVFA